MIVILKKYFSPGVSIGDLCLISLSSGGEGGT